MTSILSNNYYVNFQEDAYRKLNDFLVTSKPSSIVILVDENTKKYCLPILLKELKTVQSPKIIEIVSGEAYKNLDTCTVAWKILTELGADRKSVLINLGGGVITDLGGFVASAFKRGISFINIPTTLLSMVDASVGGKTGVDLGVLKNQIGVFSDPEMVLIDQRYLKTITDRELRSGLAEIIKYGLTYDSQLWNDISRLKEFNTNSINTYIYRSIEIKNDVVTKDPKEQGQRKILNFGHTLGHAIESYFLESKDKENLTHGEAIAIGMVTASFISSKLLNFPDDKVHAIKQTILKIYDKVSMDSNDFEAIIALLIHDKKNVGGQVNFVLLTSLENFKLDCIVEKEMIIQALDYYIN